MNNELKNPYTSEIDEGADDAAITVDGATPTKKPKDTIEAAPITFQDGIEWVLRDDTMIVNGS